MGLFISTTANTDFHHKGLVSWWALTYTHISLGVMHWRISMKVQWGLINLMQAWNKTHISAHWVRRGRGVWRRTRWSSPITLKCCSVLCASHLTHLLSPASSCNLIGRLLSRSSSSSLWCWPHHYIHTIHAWCCHLISDWFITYLLLLPFSRLHNGHKTLLLAMLGADASGAVLSGVM